MQNVIRPYILHSLCQSLSFSWCIKPLRCTVIIDMLGLTPAVLLLLMLFSLLGISHFSLPSCGLLEDLLESRFDFECFTSYGFFSGCSRCYSIAWLIQVWWCQQLTSLSEVSTLPPFTILYHPSFVINLNVTTCIENHIRQGCNFCFSHQT